MPWKDVRPMDHRIVFIADYVRGGHSVTELCALHGISRKTAYKWLSRYEQLGLEGLADHSRRPHHSPERVAYAIRQAILEFRRRGNLIMGPKKIRRLLEQRFPGQALPSKTTIYNVLKSEGLVRPRRPRQRVPPSASPFAPAGAVNEVWSVDFKGQFVLGNRRWCYPLTVMDHHSRYLICCQGLGSTAGRPARKVFERCFREYGLPRRIRSDNGTPFAARTAGGLSHLAVWWVRLGIVPERIKPGKPQQNGRHERMHRTLKKAATRPAQGSFKVQQQHFEQFRYSYNHERPHESLNQDTPATHYQPSERAYPEQLPELEYPGFYRLKRVSPGGAIYFANRMVYLSHVLAGETVGLCQLDEHVWDVYFGPLRLGGFDLATPNTKSKRRDYLSISV